MCFSKFNYSDENAERKYFAAKELRVPAAFNVRRRPEKHPDNGDIEFSHYEQCIYRYVAQALRSIRAAQVLDAQTSIQFPFSRGKQKALEVS